MSCHVVNLIKCLIDIDLCSLCVSSHNITSLSSIDELAQSDCSSLCDSLPLDDGNDINYETTISSLLM